VERICRQLLTLGVDLNTNPFLISTLKEKLPTDVLTRLVEKEMDGGVVWTPLQWRNGLMREVQIREAAMVNPAPLNKVSYQNHPPQNRFIPNRHIHSNNRVVPQNAPSNNFSKSFVRSFPVVANTGSRKRLHTHSVGPTVGHSNLSQEPGPSRPTQNNKPVNSCSLCNQPGHAPSVCPSYPTPDRRQSRLLQQNRCLRCGKSGHSDAQCRSRAVCLNCHGSHHVIICKNIGRFGTGGNSQPIGRPKQQHSSLAVVGNDEEIPFSNPSL
jgi:hypothetical protein